MNTYIYIYMFIYIHTRNTWEMASRALFSAVSFSTIASYSNVLRAEDPPEVGPAIFAVIGAASFAFCFFREKSSTKRTRNILSQTGGSGTARESLCSPHEVLLAITWVSKPATRKDLAARTWGVFWYSSKIPVLLEIMVPINKRGVQGSKSRLQEASGAAALHVPNRKESRVAKYRQQSGAAEIDGRVLGIL